MSLVALKITVPLIVKKHLSPHPTTNNMSSTTSSKSKRVHEQRGKPSHGSSSLHHQEHQSVEQALGRIDLHQGAGPNTEDDARARSALTSGPNSSTKDRGSVSAKRRSPARSRQAVVAGVAEDSRSKKKRRKKEPVNRIPVLDRVKQKVMDKIAQVHLVDHSGPNITDKTMQAADAHANAAWRHGAIRGQVRLFADKIQDTEDAVRDLTEAINVLVETDLASVDPWVPRSPHQDQQHPTCPQQAPALLHFLLWETPQATLEKLVWTALNHKVWGIAWTEFLLAAYNHRTTRTQSSSTSSYARKAEILLDNIQIEKIETQTAGPSDATSVHTDSSDSDTSSSESEESDDEPSDQDSDFIASDVSSQADTNVNKTPIHGTSQVVPNAPQRPSKQRPRRKLFRSRLVKLPETLDLGDSASASGPSSAAGAQAIPEPTQPPPAVPTASFESTPHQIHKKLCSIRQLLQTAATRNQDILSQDHTPSSRFSGCCDGNRMLPKFRELTRKAFSFLRNIERQLNRYSRKADNSPLMWQDYYHNVNELEDKVFALEKEAESWATFKGPFQSLMRANVDHYKKIGQTIAEMCNIFGMPW